MAKYQRNWRMVLPLLIAIILSGGIFFSPTPQPAAAGNNGIVINGGTINGHRPTMNISPQSNRICTVWSTYDQPSNYVYGRFFTIDSGTWAPPLSQPPVELTRSSSGSAVGLSAHCAIDGAGQMHVVWVTNPNGELHYTMLPAGADPGNGNNWTNPITLTSALAEGNAQEPDIVSIFADNVGNVWLAYWRVKAPDSVPDSSTGVFVRRWISGSGWSGETKVSSDFGKHPRIGADDAGFVQVIWQTGENDMGYAYRNPSTNTWSTPVTVPGTAKMNDQTGLAVNRSTGDVHIVFSSGPTDPQRTVKYIRKLGPTGTNFSDPVDLTGQGNYVVPRIAWSQSGRLVMVTDERANTSSIQMNTSDDNGTTWTGASLLTDGGVTNQGLPWVTMDRAGNAYVVYWNGSDEIRFIQASASPNPPNCESTTPSTTTFCDVPAGYWAYNQIQQVYAKQITLGCGNYYNGRLMYCPDGQVTRAQMAAFIERAMGNTAPPTPPRQRFTDVPSTYWAYNFIDKFAQDGITQGCGDGTTFCPEQAVTRAEMAKFMVAAKKGQPASNTSSPIFADVPQTYWDFGYIQTFYSLNITQGCGFNAAGQRLFCPDKNVTRTEMAVFLSRTTWP